MDGRGDHEALTGTPNTYENRADIELTSLVPLLERLRTSYYVEDDKVVRDLQLGTH